MSTEKKFQDLRPVSNKYFSRPHGAEAEIMVEASIKLENESQHAYRPMLINGRDISKKISLDKEYSALVMSDGMTIPVKMPFERLIKALNENVGENGYIDLSNVTGAAAERSISFKFIDMNEVFDKNEIKITFWGHDESCDRYEHHSIFLNEITAINQMPGYPERTWLKLNGQTGRVFPSGHAVYGRQRFLCLNLNRSQFISYIEDAVKRRSYEVDITEQTSFAKANSFDVNRNRPGF